MPERLAVGIDIGGTKIAGGVVDEDGRVVARARRATPSTDSTAVLDAIADLVEEFRDSYAVRAVGVGAAGYVDVTGSTVVFSPHLAWRNEPLRDAVVRRTRLPVLVDNDANAAGWAEFRFGRARAVEDMVMLTVGTGLGGALVLNGRLLRGAHGAAGEIGHMQVVPGGHYCGCGHEGCWEMYGSGRALTRSARAAAVAYPDRAGALLELAGDKKIQGPHVTAAAQAGDPLAIELFAQLGFWLGVGIADLAAAVDPEMAVVGGGVAAAGDLLLEPIRASFARHLSARGYRGELTIELAELENEAGIVGAADLARH